MTFLAKNNISMEHVICLVPERPLEYAMYN